MILYNAFFLTAHINGEKSMLLTIDRKEMQIFVFNAIQFNPKVTLEIKQYSTNLEEFKEDLQTLLYKINNGEIN